MLQCAAAQINNMTTFQCKNTFIAPIHLRSLAKANPVLEPEHIGPRQSTAVDVIVAARRWCASAMLQHKLHLLATPASEEALSCGVSAAQVTEGSVCIDLSHVRTHQTLVGALCKITHVHQSNKGCIVYNPQGRPRFARRMFEDLSYVAGPLRDKEMRLLKIFNLPQVCLDAAKGCLPGVQLNQPTQTDSLTETDTSEDMCSVKQPNQTKSLTETDTSEDMCSVKQPNQTKSLTETDTSEDMCSVKQPNQTNSLTDTDTSEDMCSVKQPNQNNQAQEQDKRITEFQERDQCPGQPRRSNRRTRSPHRFGDYVML